LESFKNSSSPKRKVQGHSNAPKSKKTPQKQLTAQEHLNRPRCQKHSSKPQKPLKQEQSSGFLKTPALLKRKAPSKGHENTGFDTPRISSP
jgi:hypothetical protein